MTAASRSLSEIRYIPICSCRMRKLIYVKIVSEIDGPHYDSDVFQELKIVYWRCRLAVLRSIMKFWLFDLREVRPVTVLLHS
jgi:hypothetical protein